MANAIGNFHIFFEDFPKFPNFCTSTQGWWVGLADLGHEGEWVWQVGFHFSCYYPISSFRSSPCTICLQSDLYRLTGRTPTSPPGTPTARTCLSTTLGIAPPWSRSPWRSSWLPSTGTSSACYLSRRFRCLKLFAWKCSLFIL